MQPHYFVVEPITISLGGSYNWYSTAQCKPTHVYSNNSHDQVSESSYLRLIQNNYLYIELFGWWVHETTMGLQCNQPVPTQLIAPW